MSLRLFRVKIRKAFECLSRVNVEVWLKMDDGQLVLMDVGHDDQELAWWGVENGSVILFYIDLEYKG